jgi:hypothetical protein
MVVKSRTWLHTTGKLHVWYHLVLFGVLGALAVRASDRFSRRLMSLVGVVLLGFVIEAVEQRGSLAAIEWGDVQMDCWGVGFGCLAMWLFSGKPEAR